VVFRTRFVRVQGATGDPQVLEPDKTRTGDGSCNCGGASDTSPVHRPDSPSGSGNASGAAVPDLRWR
jgi:hypothetical protein